MDAQRLKRLSQVIQTEATTPSIADFLATHIPFENLYLQKGTGSKEDSLNENKLFQEIICDSPEEHKLILIQGSNGSGKSHLIRWLKEKYQKQANEKEVVLLISRAHNTLQDALKQIIDADLFPEEIKENELRIIRNAKGNITGEELKKTINFNFTLEIDKDKEAGNDLLDERYRDWLKSYLTDEYIINTFLLVDNGPLSKICAKLGTKEDGTINQNEDQIFAAKDFKITLQQIKQNLDIANAGAAGNTIRLAEKFATEGEGSELRNKVAEYLNSKVSSVIQRSLNLESADFKNLFASLRSILKKQGNKLTLFIEDITSFSGLDNALMEVLITNHSAEGNGEFCRISSICGATTSFYWNSIPDNIKDRVTHNILIKEEAMLGNKKQLSYFAAKYINAINLDEKIICDWANKGAYEEAIPIAKLPEYPWAIVSQQEKDFSIFPFNETALWNLYQSLDVARRTPRVFLKNVILHVLSMWVTDPEGFLLNESRFTLDSQPIPRWKIIHYTESNKKIDPNTATQRGILLRLWGDTTTELRNGMLGGLPKSLFETFKVPSNISGEIEITTNSIEQIDVAPDSNPIPIIANNSDYNKVEEDILNWFNNKAILISHIELRDLLKDFIVASINWEVEEVNEILVNAYINTRLRVHIRGQNVEVSSGFILERQEESMYLLISLAAWKYLGDYTWNFESSEDYLVTVLSWIENNKNKIISIVKSPDLISTDWNLSLWNVAAVYLIKAIFSGVDTTNTNEALLLKLFAEENNFEYNYKHGEIWGTMAKEISTKEVYRETTLSSAKNYFSKTIGSAEVGQTRYTIVDAFEILKQIELLRSINWDLKTLQINILRKEQSLWYFSINCINEFSESIEKAINEEVQLSNDYLQIFNEALGENSNEEVVKLSLQSINDYLKFLNNPLNLNYNESDYFNISRSDSYGAFYKAIENARALCKKVEMPIKLFEISKNPFDEIEKYKRILTNFNKLVNEKNIIFISSLDKEATNLLNEKRNDITIKIEKMESEITKIGGGANGNQQ
ncbi:MAG: hypothetical protein WCF96_05550 [Eubacteriales bacterium]